MLLYKLCGNKILSEYEIMNNIHVLSKQNKNRNRFFLNIKNIFLKSLLSVFP